MARAFLSFVLFMGCLDGILTGWNSFFSSIKNPESFFSFMSVLLD